LMMADQLAQLTVRSMAVPMALMMAD
jgi:hypothetical protein